MRVSIVTGLFFISMKTFAQNYIPIQYTNAKFHSIEYIGYVPCYHVDKYCTYLSDTSIGGITYQKFRTEIFGTYPANCIAPTTGLSFFRDDSANRKSYTYINNKDSLNYDFCLLPGDTSKAYHDGFNAFQSGPVVLSLIDSISINNVWHRRFNYKLYWGPVHVYDHTIIEGIGPTYLRYSQHYTTLRCYSVNNIIIYQDGNYLCEIPLETSKHLSADPQIFVDGQLHVSGFKGIMEIFDLQGKLILKVKIAESNMMNHISLAKGMNIVRLSNSAGVFVKKVMIH